jgi:beta-lactamase superfamily II metal-dependent hydrolase
MAATDVRSGCLDDADELLAAITPDLLVYFAVNVGDGDCQLILLPAAADDPRRRRRMIVVDAIGAEKLIALITALHDEGVLGDKKLPPELSLVVATHPHADHIRGIPRILDEYHTARLELWDPGYRHASGMFMDIMDRVAEHGLTRTVVTSGMSRTIANTRITVLAPSVMLQRQFDTYGVNVNDASVTLKVEYPATRVVKERHARRTTLATTEAAIGNALVLGADAQLRSWGQVMAEFPQLGPESTPVTEALRSTGGTHPLSADVFKIPHHGSKHGLTLELIEAVSPAVSIVSCGHSGGKYQFPHEVALEQIREAVDARSSQPGVAHTLDDELVIAFTGSQLADGTKGPAGSVCVLCPLQGEPTVWRMLDGVEDHIELTAARRIQKPRQAARSRGLDGSPATTTSSHSNPGER